MKEITWCNGNNKIYNVKEIIIKIYCNEVIMEIALRCNGNYI